MGKKSAPAAPAPQPYQPTQEELLGQHNLEQEIRRTRIDSEIAAFKNKMALEESQKAQEAMAKQLSDQLKLQEEALKAPKDVVLGAAPSNIDFKTFTPSTPNLKQTEGIEGTRLDTVLPKTTTKPPTTKRIKDLLGLGLTDISFGLNT